MKILTDHHFNYAGDPFTNPSSTELYAPRCAWRNKIYESLFLSVSSTIRLLPLSRSVILQMHPSIFSFPRWFPTGHSICSKNCSRQNWQNHSEQNSDSGFFPMQLGTPKRDMWLRTNSITSSVVGLRKNIASGQLLSSSFDNIKYFFVYS